MKSIRTRFAPSPTGQLHIGGLRTALYSYALARHEGGEFLLRIEDTDKKREVAGAKEKIQELLKLFGLSWDGDIYIQSERAVQGIYKKAGEKLVEDGKAFYCDCKAKNAKEEGYSKELRDPCRDAKKTSGAIKLRVPDNEQISFTDFVLEKHVSWDTSVVADTTLLKSDGFPTYHLAVVVDDNDMGITHALRGHDWMPSTPIHLLIYKFLGYQVPQIGHLTDILDPEGGKLSKRKGSTSLVGLLSEGYLPEAMLNFVMLLGWAPKDNRELFTLDEFVKVFDPKGFQKSNPVFNKQKLDWFNKHYYQELQRKSSDKFVSFIRKVSVYADKPNFESIAVGTAAVAAPRASNIIEYDNLIRPYFEVVNIDNSLFSDRYKEHLEKAAQLLTDLEKWETQEIDKSLQDIIKQKGYNTGDFFMDLRVALTGSRVSLPSGELVGKMGKAETIKRLKALL